MALLTTEQVLKWVPQATGNEALMPDAIAEAQELAGNYCDRTLESAAHDQYFTTGDYRELLFLDWPVTVMTSVHEDAQGTSPTEVTAASGYDLDSTRGRIERTGAFWSRGFEEVRIQYTAGYTPATLPPGLRRALLQLVAWIIGGRGNVGVKAENIDGTNLQYEEMEGPIPVSIARMLDPYRRVAFC